MTNESFKAKRFRNIGVITIASVYFLILVGGVVRSTGSGMGCPDWPKCFGTWVPPTNINQLPDNYLSVYKNKRIEKNEKLANYLNQFGFHQLASEIFSHPSQYIETEFNVTKTWIEYLNRLVGVLIGVFIFLTLVYSFPYIKKDISIFYLSLISFILVGIQGWLGSLVVSTNLLPIMVTVHMALALVLVAILIYAVARSQNRSFTQLTQSVSSKTYIFIYLAIILSFVQILLGTQVREWIDIISSQLGYTNREQWVSKVGSSFYIHRSFSFVLFIVNVYLCRQLYALQNKHLNKLANGLLAFIGLEILVGVILAYFAIPALLQPVHLVLATLMFGLQFFIFIFCYYSTRNRVLKLAVQ
ncbi:COX15/CtaA family protein [Adhaeribacter radiodurans]|uniref:COX15/CtaA family protein n=1 Tax=Adhaeribacter radiodurans TaxID=2745197 RepID=A0A7L7L3P7_9BACT|nr:COX15/CtaA family protein [Adhaeribacter radiodurans]QMU27205.1 COX15/CtaA family protein [Adhaeribacter radiodurans]